MNTRTKFSSLIVLAALFAILFTACGPAATAPPTVAPTNSPAPTDPPAPTNTPAPTSTPKPSATPTQTPLPTETPTLSPTPSPTETPTATPTSVPLSSLDFSGVTLTEADLPGDFVPKSVDELQLDPGQLIPGSFPLEIADSYWFAKEADALEWVIGYRVVLEDQTAQSLFDDVMQDPITHTVALLANMDYMASAINDTGFALSGIGEAVSGKSADYMLMIFEDGSVALASMHITTVVFRRGPVGVFVLLFSQAEPTLSMMDLASTLDARIVESVEGGNLENSDVAIEEADQPVARVQPGDPTPRYMLIGSPGYPPDPNILSDEWEYLSDNWSDWSARITYENPSLGGTQLTQSFSLLAEGETAEVLFGPLPPEGYTVLKSDAGFDTQGDFSLFGKHTEKYGPSFFTVLQKGRYLYSVEITYPEKTSRDLQEFYDTEVADLFNGVLQAVLEKSGVSAPTPTPMSPDQQDFHDLTSGWLVTEEEANEFYRNAPDMFGETIEGNWELLGDEVDAEYGTVCRDFADRTNADVPLVYFSNCLYYVGPDFDIESLAEYFPTGVILESEFEYPGEFVLYAYKDGHTFFEGFLLQGEFLLYVFLESRTLSGWTPEDVFNEFNDTFIYNVLMTNLDRYDW